MRALACHSLLLDGYLVTDILNVAVQEVRDLLNGRAERETVSQFRQVDRRLVSFVLGAHGSLQRSLIQPAPVG